MRSYRGSTSPIMARVLTIGGLFAATANALNGIVAPNSVAADSEFQVTFQNGNSDSYRMYLAAALTGVNGPACYLTNSSTPSSPLTLNIPALVGPSANYYSIAAKDLTTGQGLTYSNRFNLTGGNGNYTQYEKSLGGAPFWDADALPCSSYACARECAQASYPSDLTNSEAYSTMRSCFLQCPDVRPAASASQTGPAHATATTAGSMTTLTAGEAVVTLGNDVISAIETTVTSGGKTYTEAILGAATLTLGGSSTTISGEAVSLASSGLKVGKTTTVAFSSALVTMTASSTAQDGSSGSSAAAASTSSKKSGALSVRYESFGAIFVIGAAVLAVLSM
ncbi:hypothetical protein LTS14_004495 [Recurvomyces mirabilis]|nr:hypothetical protein LTS14_004495 [Recurvomyces mirabilis]